MGNIFDFQSDWDAFTSGAKDLWQDFEATVDKLQSALEQLNISIARDILVRLTRVLVDLWVNPIDIIPQMMQRIREFDGDVPRILEEFVSGVSNYGLESFAHHMYHGVVAEPIRQYTSHQATQSMRIAQIHADTISGIKTRLAPLYNGDVTNVTATTPFAGKLAQQVSLHFTQTAADTNALATPFHSDGPVVAANRHYTSQADIGSAIAWTVVTLLILAVVDLLMISVFAAADLGLALTGVGILGEPPAIAGEIALIVLIDGYIIVHLQQAYLASQSSAIQSSQPSNSSGSTSDPEVQQVQQDLANNHLPSIPEYIISSLLSAGLTVEQIVFLVEIGLSEIELTALAKVYENLPQNVKDTINKLTPDQWRSILTALSYLVGTEQQIAHATGYDPTIQDFIFLLEEGYPPDKIADLFNPINWTKLNYSTGGRQPLLDKNGHVVQVGGRDVDYEQNRALRNLLDIAENAKNMGQQVGANRELATIMDLGPNNVKQTGVQLTYEDTKESVTDIDVVGNDGTVYSVGGKKSGADALAQAQTDRLYAQTIVGGTDRIIFKFDPHVRSQTSANNLVGPNLYDEAQPIQLPANWNWT